MPSVIEWVRAMLLLRYAFRRLIFSRRRALMDAVRPKLPSGARVAWPDAIMHIRRADVHRAMEEISQR